MKDKILAALAAVGGILTAVGLMDIAAIIDFIADNLEVVWTSVASIIAFVSALFYKIKPQDEAQKE